MSNLCVIACRSSGSFLGKGARQLAECFVTRKPRFRSTLTNARETGRSRLCFSAESQMTSTSPKTSSSDINTGRIEDEYSKIIDLHKFYLEIGTKTAAGSFAIIGAVLTFISQPDFPQNRIPFALAVPLVLSIGNALGFVAGIRFARDFKQQVEQVQRNLGASWRPHVELIIGMNIVLGTLFAVLALGLAYMTIWPEALPRLPPK
jgi:hypothetical protein